MDVNAQPDSIALWNDTLMGLRDAISTENEAWIRAYLSESIAERVKCEALAKLEALENAIAEVKESGQNQHDFGLGMKLPTDVISSAQTVCDMLREEHQIASLIQEAVKQGHTEW